MAVSIACMAVLMAVTMSMCIPFMPMVILSFASMRVALAFMSMLNIQ
eukprot:CAMPEP_0172743924 /NCGR_PEP_ID=MMETSP1074-20121228/133688_1 /TAXON_ID=2916 /ORGANISM="Ceratium fusus, Strain PA161109" /LENGTH=46 /DNA_ID= /DNA_START= /DNA_END= /DNA_ORIENTATION=